MNDLSPWETPDWGAREAGTPEHETARERGRAEKRDFLLWYIACGGIAPLDARNEEGA